MALSKTPKFDALIDEILKDLKPHDRKCEECENNFQIEADDINFYKAMRVPPPKRCPSCRQQRRLSFANYSNIYKRKCDAPGHTDIMVSIVPPVMPWVTYDYEAYYGDSWDPLSYAREIDPKASALAQIFEILKVIPQPGVRRGENSINCDFSFYGKNMKDCYYNFGGRNSENILFSAAVYRSKNAIDSYSIYDVDTVYNNISTNNCFKVNYGYFSSNCVECDFVFDCRNCQNCFGCVNLRNKNYCWENVQLTREEYFKRRDAINLGNRTIAKECQKKFWDFVKTNPIRATRVSQSQNSSGEDIRGSNNCRECFQIEGSENLKYASFAVVKLRDSMDVGHSGGSERIYNSQNCGGKSSGVKFSSMIQGSMDCEYSMSLKNCQNCFGCIGLKNVSYAIFNKKYNEKEYWTKLDDIKTQMLREGDYGEFFPMNFSPCAYNSSLAQIMYSIEEDEAKRLGVYWQESIDVDTRGLKNVLVGELPENIEDISDDIHMVAVIGEVSKKPFRVIPREIEAYKRYKLAFPYDTPYQRTLDRFKILNNFQTIKEKCYSCSKDIKSLFGATNGYKPYCEECFQREVL